MGSGRDIEPISIADRLRRGGWLFAAGAGSLVKGQHHHVELMRHYFVALMLY